MAHIVREHKELKLGEIYIEKGWELVQEGLALQSSDLFPISFLLPGEEYVWLGELKRRAIAFGAYAGWDAAVWLFENQENILAKWDRFNMVFPAAIWRDLEGSLRIPALTWEDGRWHMIFYWADQKFGPRDLILHNRTEYEWNTDESDWNTLLGSTRSDHESEIDESDWAELLRSTRR